MDGEYHWHEDRYWTDALERLYKLREAGEMTLHLDLRKIEEVAYNGDGPAYKLMHAMCEISEDKGWDGCRGAPRVMLALLIRLADISERESESS